MGERDINALVDLIKGNLEQEANGEGMSPEEVSVLAALELARVALLDLGRIAGALEYLALSAKQKREIG